MEYKFTFSVGVEFQATLLRLCIKYRGLRTLNICNAIVLRFYHIDKNGKFDSLIHASGSKVALIKQLTCVLNLFELSPATFNLFSYVVKKHFDHVSKVSGFGCDPKNPPPF